MGENFPHKYIIQLNLTGYWSKPSTFTSLFFFELQCLNFSLWKSGVAVAQNMTLETGIKTMNPLTGCVLNGYRRIYRSSNLKKKTHKHKQLSESSSNEKHNHMDNNHTITSDQFVTWSDLQTFVFLNLTNLFSSVFFRLFSLLLSGIQNMYHSKSSCHLQQNEDE